MWKRKVVAMLLGICMTSQLCVNAFALENDKNSNANVEMNVSLAEQNSILELELKSSISQYLEEGADVSGIEELILNTSNGYQLTLSDLECLKTNFVKLNQLDVKECQFDSKDTYDAFWSY